MAKVSLIIPTFNRPHLLPRCVNSALRAGSSVEVIVVDDASSDETASVCQKLREIKYVRLAFNKGVAGARNEGLRASTSEYVGFLDDDDLRLPNSIDAQVDLLDAYPGAGMVYGRALYGDEQCVPKGDSYPDVCPQGDIFWELMQSNFVPCLTVIFRRTCLERVGLLDESATGVDDWDLWVRISELYPVLATEHTVAIWRRPTPTSGQFSFRADRMHRRAHRLHRDKWLRLPRSMAANEERRNQASRAFADRATQQMISEARSRYKAGRVIDSIRLAFEMARLYPRAAARHALRASIGSPNVFSD
ncbi:MAG TPA: glycosyltransferase [Pyrinomonadaceae bacterium]|jgi:glycosyltransferase involved in cell wall biosynthesis|nr:glycosyltransferase [Pyrinomonadaceae bacterium]